VRRFQDQPLPRFFDHARACADLSFMRSCGGACGNETLLVLTLVLVDGYLLFPSAAERAARDAPRDTRDSLRHSAGR